MIYQDRRGKILAVWAYVRGSPHVLIVSHLPHTDADRVAFLEKHGPGIRDAIASAMAAASIGTMAYGPQDV